MNSHKKLYPLLLVLALAACLPQGAALTPAPATDTPTPGPTATALPARPEYNPGELVDYIAQTGDSLPALAVHFNTTVQEIRDANPDIPADATSMPPGMPMKIPIYYLPFWGTTFQILPDSLFINGPAVIGFDSGTFVASQPGWLKDYRAYAAGANRSGAEIVDLVATNYSVSPRVLLALLEYQTGALSQANPPSGYYPLGEQDYNYSGLYMQLIWAANMLNYGYYAWRTGSLTEITHSDGVIERPDPWQTAASVGFQYYFSLHFASEEYSHAIGPAGLASSYQKLFGDPWAVDQPHIPVSLQQPELTFPWPVGKTWVYVGGPHNSWGNAQLYPWAALDFAPPLATSGCIPSPEMATAVADGVVVRSETGVVMLDLDGDGDERTGWDILYLHLATEGRAQVGQILKTGDPVGHPSCEGGTAIDSHIHIARKYNGEWMPVDGVIPFNMDGWIAHIGDSAYQGTLRRGNQTIIACGCSDAASQVKAGK